MELPFPPPLLAGIAMALCYRGYFTLFFFYELVPADSERLMVCTWLGSIGHRDVGGMN